MKKNGKGMKISEGSETSEDRRGKGGKVIYAKILAMTTLKESEMEKRKREKRNQMRERGQTIKHIRWKGGERVRIKIDGWNET